MICYGIDSGAKGYIVKLDTSTTTAFYSPLPYHADKRLDLYKIESYFDGMKDAQCIIVEKVRGRGGWSANVNFQFGWYFGQLSAYLYNKPHHLVEPKEWQSIAHFSIHGDSPKEKSYAAFKKMNPNSTIKKSKDGIIDAFHIARYGLFLRCQKFKDDWSFVNVDKR